jgi:hypothetical protein
MLRSKGQDLGERLTFSTEDGTESGECPFFWPGNGGRWWKIMSKGWTPASIFRQNLEMKITKKNHPLHRRCNNANKSSTKMRHGF